MGCFPPLTAKDLNFVCLGEEGLTSAPRNLAQAIGLRCKILDAFYIFSLPSSERPRITWTIDENDPRLGPADPEEWGEAFLFCFLAELTNGDLPHDRVDNNPYRVWLLLKRMKFLLGGLCYAGKVASFDIRRTDGRWMSSLKILDWDPEDERNATMAWRPYQVFEDWEDKPDADPIVNRAAQFCKKLASMAPSWDYHPRTWPKEIEEQLSPVVESTWSLLIFAFSPVELLRARAAGLLLGIPEKLPASNKWLLWDPAKVIQPKNFIFKQ